MQRAQKRAVTLPGMKSSDNRQGKEGVRGLPVDQGLRDLRFRVGIAGFHFFISARHPCYQVHLQIRRPLLP